MTTFLFGAFGGLVGALCGIALREWIEMRSKPYRYICLNPECHFAVRSNDIEVLHALASHHESHHREESA